MKEISRDRVREAALRILDHGDNTEKELFTKLSGKHFDGELIREVIENLKAAELIDDRRYAESYVMSALDRGKGSVWIRNKLIEKGVSREIIEEKFEEQAVLESENRRCMEHALVLCGLDRDFEVDEYGCPCALEGSTFAYEKADWFGRKTDPESGSYAENRKSRSSEKNRLMRRLVSAGFSGSAVTSAVSEIERL